MKTHAAVIPRALLAGAFSARCIFLPDRLCGLVVNVSLHDLRHANDYAECPMRHRIVWYIVTILPPSSGQLHLSTACGSVVGYGTMLQAGGSRVRDPMR
jgi:hypothetical protein